MTVHEKSGSARRITRIAASSAAMLAALVVLSACNTGSVTDGLQTQSAAPSPAGQQAVRPQTAVGSETALAPVPPAAGSADALNRQAEPAPPATTAAIPQLPPVAFLPVTGAPQSAVTDLARSMRSAAEANSVPVVVSTEQGARYQIKGYFSALKDGNETVLVYVWDVLDANGNRIHRISGQERGSGSSGDPWTGITASVIDSVARTTMAGLRSWISTRG